MAGAVLARAMLDGAQWPIAKPDRYPNPYPAPEHNRAYHSMSDQQADLRSWSDATSTMGQLRLQAIVKDRHQTQQTPYRRVP